MVEVSSTFVYLVVFALEIALIIVTVLTLCLSFLIIGFLISSMPQDVNDEGVEVSEIPQSGISDQYGPCPESLYGNICSFV